MKSLFFASVIGILITNVASAETKIINPRVNNRIEPVGVDDNRLVFSWNLSDPIPDTNQTEYRITVKNLWDSGWIESARCIEMPYQGLQLKSSTKYHWMVQVKNNRGEISQLEKLASFTMGIQSEQRWFKSDEPNTDRGTSDWKAKWITMNRTDKDPLPIFRKSFEIDPTKKIEHAVVHICGLGHFELNINGEKVGDHFIDPGWTNYRRTCLYVSFDLTDSLKSGENVFGVLLGNGMYNVPGGRYVKFTGSFGPPKMICQLHIKYTDGSEQLVSSDESWKATLGPILFSCVYGGEDWDMRRVENGWDKPGFKEGKHWTNAVIADEMLYTVQAKKQRGKTEQMSILTHLAPQEVPPITVAETKKPETLKRLPDGRYVADFGHNFSGRPRVILKGQSGQTTIVKTAEIIDRIWDGHSYTITLNGDEEELLLPKFTYFGFQFLYIEGVVLEKDRTEADVDKPTLVTLEADFTTSSAEIVGAFKCSNELLNEIDVMIDRSIRSNLASVLTDCPHREKLGWLEVAHLMGPSIMSRYNVQNLYRKICQDMLESQIQDDPYKGLIPDIAPEYTRFSDGFLESPEWGSASIQLPWLLFKYYGDVDIFLQKRFGFDGVIEMQKKYVEYLHSTWNEKGLVKAGLGDWYDWSEEKGHAGYSQHTPRELTATAVFIDNVRILNRLGNSILENVFWKGPQEDLSGDQNQYKKLYAETVENYRTAYLNAETEQVATGSQSAIAETLYALGNDERILQQLVAKIEADDYKPTVGEVSFPKVIRALVAGNRNDILWKMTHRTDKPGYGYMLKERGMKTLSETWDGPGSSMNHCMFGHIQEWFTGTIVGINLADSWILGETYTHSRSNEVKPQFVLNPIPVGDLTWAKGHYDSVYGRVESSWKIKNDMFCYDFVIPANTTAMVRLPNGQQQEYGSGSHSLKIQYKR